MVLALSALAGIASAADDAKSPATYKELPSEIPEHFKSTQDGFDHVRRNVMIPMRDGVKLHTVILLPKGARNAPILLTRTPYDATKLTTHAHSAHLGPVLTGYDNATDVIIEGGYIRVVQDVRGKHGSEGDYVVNRPLRGPLNPTPVDHATDTYDTIEWLVKHVPETNGKVGILGISYDGFLPLMALVDPHPALRVSVPMNPMVDGWIGDDWFHNGAFRQLNVNWIYDQVATREGDEKWWTTHHDVYDMFMQAGSAGELGRRRGLDQLGFWRKLTEHPAYDAFWREQAVDKLLAKRPLKVPVMLVHSLWDQEDIYGAPAVYKALEPKDADNDKVFLVMGPWYHGQMIADGSALGMLKFHADTAREFRRKVLAPFLAQHLKDDAPKADIAPVTAFETGTNAWRRLSAWPPKAGQGDGNGPKRLYLRSGLKLSFDGPGTGETAFDEYVSDPAKPVPFRARPIQPMGYAAGQTWSRWLVDDQREASGRPDVLVFVSDVLTKPVQIAGEPVANLVASTSGSDSDWVVKLIDVYPDEVADQPELGGYQLMVAADIFRGRYRDDLEKAKAIEPDKPLAYRFALPTANHVFLPGHRLMVQVQSSWFPLYDRNPQTFVPNIFWAKPGDYAKATQRVYHEPGRASFVELPVVPVVAASPSPAPSAAGPGRDPKKLQVLILTGYNMHDWRAITVALRATLEETGRFEVRVNEEPVGCTERTFDGYDAIVLNFTNHAGVFGPPWPEQTRRALLGALDRGKGVVAFHAALSAHADWPTYEVMIGGAWRKGAKHAPYHTFRVDLKAADHPILKGLPPSFVTHDELNQGLTMQPGITMLATAYDDPDNRAAGLQGIRGSGKDEPVMWALQYGRGRVFTTALGHDLRSVRAPGFVATFQRGVEWAATGEVTIAPPPGLRDGN